MSQTGADDEATQSLADSFMGGISFGELVTDDAVDMATGATDEEESSSEESSFLGVRHNQFKS